MIEEQEYRERGNDELMIFNEDEARFSNIINHHLTMFLNLTGKKIVDEV